MKIQTVEIEVIRHPFHQHIFFMLKKPTHHCVTRRRLQRKDRFPVFRPAINTDARMSGLVFGYRANAVYMLAIYQEWRVRGVDKRIIFRQLFKERYQFLLCGWMQMQPRLVE